MNAANDNDDAGHVYVVGFDQYVKIGWSGHIEKRLRAIAHGLPQPLSTYATFVGCMNCEYGLQERFRAYRAGRGEWFSRDGELAEWINSGCPSGLYLSAIRAFPGTSRFWQEAA